MILAMMLGAADVPPTPRAMWLTDSNGINCSVTRLFETPETTVRFGIWQKLTESRPSVVVGRFTSGARVETSTVVADGTDTAAIARTGDTILSGAYGYPVTLDRAVIDEANVKLQTCLSRLPEKYDVPTPLRYVAPPANAATFFDSDAFRQQFQRKAPTGRIDLLLVFGTDGKAESCRLVLPSGNSDLDKLACEEARRNVRIGPGPAGRFTAIVKVWGDVDR